MRFILNSFFRFWVLLFQSIFLAVSQINANKVRSALTTIGIVIGVASVTAVIAALSGLKAKVLDQFESLGANRVWCWPERPETGPMKNYSWNRVQFKPEQFEGVLDRCPSLQAFTFDTWGRYSIYFGNEQVDDVAVHGINPSWHEIVGRDVLEGRRFTVIDEEEQWPVCYITPDLKKKLQLDRDCIGQAIEIDNRSFRIIGVVEEEDSHFDMGSSTLEVCIPFSTAWKLWRPGMNAQFKTRNAELTEEAIAELRFFLRNTRRVNAGDPDNFQIRALNQALEEFYNVAGMMTAVAGGIVSISLLVGGIGIMNIMLVSVSERTREIGLRKAVGARPSAIMMQFLIEAIVLCMLGGLLGLGLGRLLCLAIAKIPNAQLEQAYIPWWAVGLAFGFSAFVGIFFGLFPAVKAARLDPIEALRHE